MAVLLSESTFVWGYSTSNVLYFPMFEPMRAAEVTTARVTLELRFRHNNLVVQPYAEWSYDGATWTPAADPKLGDSVASDTIAYPTGSTGFETVPLPTSGKQRWVRFGVVAWLTTGSVLASGYATLRLETKA